MSMLHAAAITGDINGLEKVRFLFFISMKAFLDYSASFEGFFHEFFTPCMHVAQV